MIARLQTFLILFLIIQHICQGFPADSASVENFRQNENSFTEKRVSTLLSGTVYLQTLSATRFLPVFNLVGAGNWHSPGNDIYIDGIPFSAFPLNMITIDLAPIEIITSEVLVPPLQNSIHKFGVSPGGALKVESRPIPDTLSADIRIFTGSETGDPLIYIFTLPDEPHINKNKIGPSFALAYSNRMNNWAYRISGGGFFYFSTGSVNDHLFIPYASQYVDRQNRQVKIALEGEYTIDDLRRINASFSGLNLYGWEMSPFTSLFSHYTGLNSRTKFHYRDRRGFSVGVVRDDLFIWSKEMLGMPAGDYRYSLHSVNPLYQMDIFSNLDIVISADISIVDLVDSHSKATPDRQRLLARDISAINWGSSLMISHTVTGMFAYDAGFRIERSFIGDGELSGEFRVILTPTATHSFRLYLGTLASFPRYIELYGVQYVVREDTETAMIDTFLVTGNNLLNPERMNEISLNYRYNKGTGVLSAEIGLFARWTGNHIIQRVNRAVKTTFPGDIVRSAQYVNDSARFLPGVTFGLRLKPTSFFSIRSDHIFTDNIDDQSIPRYQSTTEFSFSLPFGLIAEMALVHTGETIWESFMVTPENDMFDGTGFDGVVNGSTAVHLSLSRSFNRLYFAKNVNMRAEIQNIFNAKIQRIPVGNIIERGVFVYLSFGI